MSSDLLASTSGERLDVFERLAVDPTDVGESDFRQARAGFVAVLNYYETLFYAHQRGDVEPDIWESRRFRMASFIGPVRDPLWEPIKPGFGKCFREFVDHEILPAFSANGGSLGASVATVRGGVSTSSSARSAQSRTPIFRPRNAPTHRSGIKATGVRRFWQRG